MIRQWLRGFKRQSPGELALREIIDSDSNVLEAIHFEEVGLPSGKTTTIQWWLTGTFAIARVAERATPSVPPAWQRSEHDAVEFKRLAESIGELDTPMIESFFAPVRDGGYCHIAWGNRNSVRSVVFQIPFKGDRRQKLVELIKTSVVHELR